MKNLGLILKNYLFLFLLVATIGCTKDDIPSAFTITTTVDVAIEPGLTTLNSHHYQILNIPTNYDQLLAASGYTAEQITGIQPARARLVSVFSSGSYAFLQDVEISVFDNTDPDFMILSFYRDNIPNDTGTELDLIPSLANVENLLSSATYSVDLNLKRLRFSSPQAIETRLEIDFNVTR